ncbi:MAG: c-type cytochrome biogenesis protein CcmI [Rhodomicrobium sp.]|nr:c-type cytochrome biogenesis protein CcmI [Rhodomicrobium sp.]
MTLWLIFTILLAGAALIVAAPFLLRNARGAMPTDLSVYKDQLARSSAIKAQGLIDDAEALRPALRSRSGSWRRRRTGMRRPSE